MSARVFRRRRHAEGTYGGGGGELSERPVRIDPAPDAVAPGWADSVTIEPLLLCGASGAGLAGAKNGDPSLKAPNTQNRC